MISSETSRRIMGIKREFQNGKRELKRQRQASESCHLPGLSPLHSLACRKKAFWTLWNPKFPLYVWCMPRELQSNSHCPHHPATGQMQLPFPLTSSSRVLKPQLFQPDTPHLWSICMPSTAGLCELGLLPVISNLPNLQTGSWDTRTFLGISWPSAQILYPCLLS